ncbi:hypothetical protein OEZ86_005475 [Tetradesmus obliquus]|nr:hypothetical protein OEZ86_005475 [Tetradesmus obliquus]
MHEPTVYEILNSTQKGNKQTSRLLHALEELAGRLESVSAHGVGGVQAPAAADSSTLRQRGSGRYHRGGSLKFSSLQLPDPQSESLPLFPGASEFDALQAAATSSSSQLRSRAERHAWRSWLMAPSHVPLVMEAAWLLLALLFRQDDPCAAALQERVHTQLSQHYVSEVLSGQGIVENAAGLWAQALADAACHLLRSAFPSVAELADAQLQQVLQRQLRLWTTGWLSEPSGAAAALPASVTDAQCKAQRQLMQSHLRYGEWKLAHTFNASVHDKCLDMAAAVAVVPRTPASNGPGSGSSSSNGGNADARFDRPGGGWADIAGCGLVSSRLSKARAGGGAAAAAVSATKVTKAAKAIVEDVRRKYAASPAVSSPPRRR